MKHFLHWTVRLPVHNFTCIHSHFGKILSDHFKKYHMPILSALKFNFKLRNELLIFCSSTKVAEEDVSIKIKF
jgi:hypothetical protein